MSEESAHLVQLTFDFGDTTSPGGEGVSLPLVSEEYDDLGKRPLAQGVDDPTPLPLDVSDGFFWVPAE